MGTSNYTVRKLGWYQPPHGDPYTRRLPPAEPVAQFDSFDEAEMYRRELEADAREGENPFRFGGGSVFFQSSLDGPRLHDWIMDAGIEPATSELRHRDWRAWWGAFAHTWNPDQLAHAWAALDKVRFFDVVETPVYTAHVALWITSARNRNLAPLRTERGQLAGVSRKPRADIAPRPGRQANRDAGYESVAVPSNVPPLAGVGFLVQRRVVLNQTFRGERNQAPANTRVPLALFANRAEADEHRALLATEARQTLNPFVFVEPDAGAATATGREAFARLSYPLPLPDNDRRAEWLEWYDLCQDETSDEQRAAVWDQCNQPLFEALRVGVSDG